MTRDPDDDIARKRMELALREANLGVHQAWLQKAEHILDAASSITTDLIRKDVVPPEEREEAYRMATLMSVHISAISTYVQTAMMVEAEASNVQHLLGHQQHDEEEQAHIDAAQEAIRTAMGEAMEKMREQGIDVYPAPGGFPGFVIRKPEEGPDGPLS